MEQRVVCDAVAEQRARRHRRWLAVVLRWTAPAAIGPGPIIIKLQHYCTSLLVALTCALYRACGCGWTGRGQLRAGPFSRVGPELLLVPPANRVGGGCCSEETGRSTSRSAFVHVVGLLNTYLPLTVINGVRD